jgi:hypothetical protein
VAIDLSPALASHDDDDDDEEVVCFQIGALFSSGWCVEGLWTLYDSRSCRMVAERQSGVATEYGSMLIHDSRMI